MSHLLRITEQFKNDPAKYHYTVVAEKNHAAVQNWFEQMFRIVPDIINANTYRSSSGATMFTVEEVRWQAQIYTHQWMLVEGEYKPVRANIRYATHEEVCEHVEYFKLEYLNQDTTMHGMTTDFQYEDEWRLAEIEESVV